MKPARLLSWIVVCLGALYFLLPLYATFQFSLSMLRGQWTFEAYRVVFADQRFQDTFLFSVVCALLTIALGTLLVVPTAYWVRLRLPRLKPYVEFVTLLPLVIPPIVLVFGYLRLYNSSSWLPFTGTVWGTNVILVFGYTVLALPYMYRAVDTGLQAIDIRTLTEAAESLGARRSSILWSVILPNVRAAVLSGAFLTFAIVIGEFVLASLLNRPAFGPYLQNVGANRAYEPAALAMIAFAVTWGCMVLLHLAGGGTPGRARAFFKRRAGATP
ncbi:ABC transporter permease [Aureimonas sp. ME7]|uniref:ABC transporter permease n=1 Tax=Aureimonas sp. ME7 TaxID=2744252 RepID=UPI0015F5DDF1|nr:ABC transporter permease [Aureimonas sp. ME7]